MSWFGGMIPTPQQSVQRERVGRKGNFLEVVWVTGSQPKPPLQAAVASEGSSLRGKSVWAGCFEHPRQR